MSIAAKRGPRVPLGDIGELRREVGVADDEVVALPGEQRERPTTSSRGSGDTMRARVPVRRAAARTAGQMNSSKDSP